jgi:pyruvate formate lyase activating enzyme
VSETKPAELRQDISIGGVVWTSLVDLAGRVSSVIFLKGCNFCCGYCQNPSLIEGGIDSVLSIDDLLSGLDARRGFIDGVVISGGEPTIQKGLIFLLKEIKGQGHKVKLDTNGSKPDVLEYILNEGLADRVSMDVKTSLNRYAEAAGVDVSVHLVLKSISLLKGLGEGVEYRTTLVPGLVGEDEIREIASMLPRDTLYSLQEFFPKNAREERYRCLKPYNRYEMQHLFEIASDIHEYTFLKGY